MKTVTPKRRTGPRPYLHVWATLTWAVDPVLVYRGNGRGTAGRLATELVAYGIASDTRVEQARAYRTVGPPGRVLLDALEGRKARR